MKKIIALVMAAVMLASCIGVCMADETTVQIADANMDGQITLSDCSLILKYVAKWDLSSTTFSKENADVNTDGKITLSDASHILRKIINYWNP